MDRMGLIALVQERQSIAFATFHMKWGNIGVRCAIDSPAIQGAFAVNNLLKYHGKNLVWDDRDCAAPKLGVTPVVFIRAGPQCRPRATRIFDRQSEPGRSF